MNYLCISTILSLDVRLIKMSKLTAQDKFFDLSDYGRPLATVFANQLKDTRFTPIHVTLLFGISGIIAIYCILNGFIITLDFLSSSNQSLMPLMENWQESKIRLLIQEDIWTAFLILFLISLS